MGGISCLAHPWKRRARRPPKAIAEKVCESALKALSQGPFSSFLDFMETNTTLSIGCFPNLATRRLAAPLFPRAMPLPPANPDVPHRFPRSGTTFPLTKHRDSSFGPTFLHVRERYSRSGTAFSRVPEAVAQTGVAFRHQTYRHSRTGFPIPGTKYRDATLGNALSDGKYPAAQTGITSSLRETCPSDRGAHATRVLFSATPPKTRSLNATPLILPKLHSKNQTH